MARQRQAPGAGHELRVLATANRRRVPLLHRVTVGAAYQLVLREGGGMGGGWRGAMYTHLVIERALSDEKERAP